MERPFSEIQKIISGSTIGIAGAGGLGSNCAVSLARIGIGKLIIADFDIVSESNLNRQYYFSNQIGEFKVKALKENIEKTGSATKIEIHQVKITSENIKDIFKNCDIIVEAFDKADQKQILLETVITELPEKYIVSGVGMAGWGKNEIIKTLQFDKIFICGDQTNEISENQPPLAPRVSIVANMQANQVLDILINILH